MKKNKDLYVMVVAVAFLIVIVSAVTYAYINKANVTGETPIDATILDDGPHYTLLMTGDTTLSLTVTESDLSSHSGSNEYTSYVDGASTDLTLSFELSDASEIYSCDYTISYVPRDSFTPAQTTYSELVLMGESYLGEKIENFDLAGVSGKTTVYSGNVVSDEDETWTFYLRFYNLDVDQSASLGQSPSGNILVEASNCVEA